MPHIWLVPSPNFVAAGTIKVFPLRASVLTRSEPLRGREDEPSTLWLCQT